MTSPTSANWFLDSGATNHVTNELSNLSIQHPSTDTTGVMVGNGNTLSVSHTGKGLLHTPTTCLSLNDLLHVPSISQNLLSVHKLATDNHCSLLLIIIVGY